MGRRAAIYARLSTADQSCERQVAELTVFAERGGFEVLGIFKEAASGARNNRLARNQVLERWGGSTQDLLDTPHGRMMATMFAATAQFERDLLSERVKFGLAAARAAGQEARPSAWPATQVRPTRPERAPCHRWREKLPVVRPRPRYEQEHSRRQPQTASGERLA